eukprot:TRINITY_DN926_c0_g1_i4.p1 TRINITY_DN926_c0_g1~~TRINITY_DN926_c0_g1_i4.p1  ORF type:complete len:132 (-),score=5.58 TRINITY_DN926_c0_g1_i4:123-518(-)
MDGNTLPQCNLVVTVKQCQTVTPCQSPYCVVYFGRTKWKTKVHSNPSKDTLVKWNESVIFNLNSEAANTGLQVELRDKVFGYIPKIRSIGTVTIPITAEIRSSGGSRDFELLNSSRVLAGNIKIRFQCIYI